MPDREKVIKGLEEIRDCESIVFQYRIDALEEAIALLKAQEPRLMTVDEIRTWIAVPRIDREPIWVETENSVNVWIVSDEYWDMPIDVTLSSDLYGKTWRCWTSRPTDEQREATPWEP